MAANPWKSSITVWSMCAPSSASTVRVISGSPPSSSAAFTFAVPWPGMSTQRSRMIEMP